MLRSIISLLIFFVFFSLGASAISYNIAHKPFAIQCRFVDSLLGALNKSSSYTLDELTRPALKNAIDEEDEVLEMLLQIKKLEQAWRTEQLRDDRFLSQIESFTNKCIKKEWKHLAAIAYDITAFYWYKEGEYAKEVKYAIKSYELYSKLDTSIYIYKMHHLMKFGSSYNRFKDYKNALRYFYEALAIAPKFDAELLNRIALNHLNNKDSDSALYYFDALYNGAIKNNKIKYQILARSNTISIYTSEGQYDTAMILSKTLLPLIRKKFGPSHLANMLDGIGYIYLLQGKYKEADRYTTEALAVYRSIDTNWYFKRLPVSLLVYEHAAKIKAGLGKYKQAYLYTDSMKLVKDSLKGKISLVKLKDIEKEFAKSKLDFANQKLFYQQTQVKQQRNLLVLSIIAATFIVLFIINRFKNRRKILEQEKRYANTRLKESQDKLSAFTKSIQDKNKLLESFEQKLNRYEPDENTIEQNNSIKELRDATILTDEEWEDFKNNFEIVHVGYLSRLKDKYPKLTPAEIRYVVLSKLKMDTKGMASVLGVSTNSIRTLKSRVIKKMNLSQEELTDIVNAI